MNCLKNSRSILSRLLRHRSHVAAAPTPTPAPVPAAQSPASRYYYASRVLRNKPAVSRPAPPPQLPRPRHYYTSPRRQEVIHFDRRRGGSRWYHDQRKLTAAVLITGGGAVAFYFGHLETVPYTNRSHLVVLSPRLERQLGETQFTELKKEFGPKILPPLHPDSIRVRLIASEIVRAVHRGLSGHQRHAAAYGEDASYGYGGIADDLAIKNRDADATAAMFGASPDKNASAAVAAQRDDEVLDDRWVTESRSRGKARGAQPQTGHLDGLNWEVIVVKDDIVNAFCLPGGKIVVFTGLLNKFKADAEVATVLGHEVGHAIARHAAEQITKNLWVAILQIVILQFIYMPDLINMVSTLLLRLPFSRRMEIEADHIGLLLLAAAGYDPRVAPSVYEKLGKIGGDSALNNYLSTHPSSKKRAQLLSRASVMNEALELYREVSAGQGTEGFL
ncbi:LOW QUALITY PROTEIN: mitochondrial metalloendopeptidase OMA1-like [Miscanthus floridulus]|uniref:LOW QUALITY PROTEIN: mitochondrial metalloendopeptidase OMA1-like n=1 Tax=Miscanthus floridulus TaxID=154761 RepID=UPI003458D0EF